MLRVANAGRLVKGELKILPWFFFLFLQRTQGREAPERPRQASRVRSARLAAPWKEGQAG